MRKGIVIDANVMAEFSQVICADDDLCRMVQWLGASYSLVASEVMLTEWENTCSLFFREWLTDELKVGRVRKTASPCIDRGVEKRFRIDFGFPNKSLDLEYLRCAHATDTRYVLTEDMDFYDPKLKKADPKSKRAARESRKGNFCRFLKKKLSITVGTKLHCRQDFNIP